MEEWVLRALKRWPNVPALYGWLKLDRRGRWMIQGELITRPQIIEVIDRNYACDERGCWFFQNGPQRGYMELERAPFILRVCAADSLWTHNDLEVTTVRAAYLDEEGGLYLSTEHGPAALLDTDLDWALARIMSGQHAAHEQEVLDALTLPSGARAPLALSLPGAVVPITRLDNAAAPEHLHFVRNPKP